MLVAGGGDGSVLRYVARYSCLANYVSDVSCVFTDFLQEEPKRVLVVGGGDGSVL